MSRFRAAAAAAGVALLLHASPAGSDIARFTTATIPRVGVRSPGDASAKAARDSLRAERRRRRWQGAELAGSAWSITSDRRDDGRRAPSRPRPQLPTGIHWPDRPLRGLGTHVPRAGTIELEAAAVAYSRSVRRELGYELVPTTGGYGYVRSEHRIRIESTRAFAPRWSLGISEHVALVGAGDGFVSWTRRDLVTNDSGHDEGWPPVRTLGLKVRAVGSDTSAWAHAFAFLVSSTTEDSYDVTLAIAQAIPLGAGRSARISAAVSQRTIEQTYYFLDFFAGGGTNYTTTPVFAALAFEQRVTPRLWIFAEVAIDRDLSVSTVREGTASLGVSRAFGSHFMLDAGARLGTTLQTPDVQGFVGFALR